MNISADIDRGMCCAECTTYFVAAHGRRVICGFCARRIGTPAVVARDLTISTQKERA